MSKPKVCPKCGSIFINWDRYGKVFRCSVRSCGWSSRYKKKGVLSRDKG